MKAIEVLVSILTLTLVLAPVLMNSSSKTILILKLGTVYSALILLRRPIIRG